MLYLPGAEYQPPAAHATYATKLQNRFANIRDGTVTVPSLCLCVYLDTYVAATYVSM
jgi:hypothetical protein